MCGEPPRPAMDEVASRRPGTLRPHRRQRGAQGPEDAAEVDRLHLVPLLVGDVVEAREAADAGVGDDDVEAAELVVGHLHRELDVGGLADVTDDGDRPPAGLPHQRARLLELVFRWRSDTAAW